MLLDSQPPTVTIDAPALEDGACLEANQQITVSGRYADLSPATTSPVQLEVFRPDPIGHVLQPIFE